MQAAIVPAAALCADQWPLGGVIVHDPRRLHCGPVLSQNPLDHDLWGLACVWLRPFLIDIDTQAVSSGR